MNTEVKPQEDSVQALSLLASRCGSMQSFDRLLSIGYHLIQTTDIPGDVVEFGCYIGLTSAYMTGLTDKTVHVYDSFQGLPEKGPQDIVGQWFKKGHLQADAGHVIWCCEHFGLRAPTIHTGWFKDFTSADLPEKIAFAHIDGDFYSSITDALKLVYPRTSPGGFILVDDYGWEDLQGAKLATDEFFAGKPEKLIQPWGLKGERATQAVVQKC